MTAVGFEPMHPKIVELESTALDHSAKLSAEDSILLLSSVNIGCLSCRRRHIVPTAELLLPSLPCIMRSVACRSQPWYQLKLDSHEYQIEYYALSMGKL